MAATDTTGASTPPVRNAAATRARILWTAHAEFAACGLKGTRIDAIARRAGCNKALIYHYFTGKEDLFREVLEVTYADIREAERRLDLECRPPLDAMRELVGFSFDYVSRNPEFVAIINDANMHGGVHLSRSTRARDLNSPLVVTIRRILRRGERSGEIRQGVDPVQLYISIASISYFFIANRATLSAIFALDRSDAGVAERRVHVIDVILGYLRPIPGEPPTIDGDLP